MMRKKHPLPSIWGELEQTKVTKEHHALDSGVSVTGVPTDDDWIVPFTDTAASTFIGDLNGKVRLNGILHVKES